MKLNCRKGAAAIAFCSLLITFSSCEARDRIAGSETPVTLVISSRLYSPVSEQRFLYDEIFPEFEEKNNVIVKFEILDDEVLLDRALQQKETGRITSDIVIVHNSRMKEWVQGDLVETLPVAEWEGRTFSPAFADSITYGKNTYFAPVGGDVYLLLANRRALPYLKQGSDIQHLSWEEYADWSISIAEGEGEGKVAAEAVPEKSMIYMLGGLFLSYGADFPDINSEGALKGWSILETMRNSFYPGILSCDNISLPMKSREAWLTVGHMARIGEVYRSAPEDFVIAPAPYGTEGIGSIAGTSGFAVLKGAENRDMAFRFIEFMTRPDIAVKVARGTGGFLPPINEAVDELGDSPTDEVIKKGIMVLRNGVVSGVPGGDYTSWGSVKRIYDKLFEEMILRDGTLDRDRVEAAQSEIGALKKSR